MNLDIVTHAAAQSTAWLTSIKFADGEFNIGDGDVDPDVETFLSNTEANVLRGFAGFLLLAIVYLFAKGLVGDGKIKWGLIVVAGLALYVALTPNNAMDTISSIFGSLLG